MIYCTRYIDRCHVSWLWGTRVDGKGALRQLVWRWIEVRRELLDEVDVVRDAARLTCAHRDEDAVVEPRQLGVGGLDADRRAERVLGGVDVLAGGQAREHVWFAVANPVRLDVEERSPIGLERVADVGDRGA